MKLLKNINLNKKILELCEWNRELNCVYVTFETFETFTCIHRLCSAATNVTPNVWWKKVLCYHFRLHKAVFRHVKDESGSFLLEIGECVIMVIDVLDSPTL